MQPLAPPPDTYRIVYRVENIAGGDRTVSTDELWVRRPFGSRLESRAGSPPGGAVASVVLSDFGLLASFGPNSSHQVVRVAPGTPNGDLRLATVLDELVTHGHLRPLEGTRRILGRTSQRFLTGEPIGTGRLLRPTNGDDAELCIDRAGLRLEETWRVGGGPSAQARRRGPDGTSIPDEMLQPEAPVMPPEQGGGELIPVEPTSRPPATLWELPRTPEGFDHVGRYLFRPPGAPGDATVSRPETVFDACARGPDFVLISQGSISANENAPPDGRPVRLEHLGRAGVQGTVFGTSVLARPDAVRYVRVVSTLKPKQGSIDRLEPAASPPRPTSPDLSVGS